MWELDHKQSWALKNWCFQAVVLEKILKSPLDSKEIKPVNPKGNQSWIFTGRTDAETDAPIVWPSDMKDSFEKTLMQFFSLGGQSIGDSASTSVLPVNIQDWFPLGFNGWISLQSKGLSRVFSNTTVKNISSLVLSFLYSPTLTSIHDWKNHSFD